jgi:hypothetical protein
MSDHYSIEEIAYGKIAEEREAAARHWLAVRAEKARREAQRTEESPLASLLRTLACAFGFGRPMQASTVPGRHAQ